MSEPTPSSAAAAAIAAIRPGSMQEAALAAIRPGSASDALADWQRDRLLSVRKVAASLSTSEEKVRRMIREGLLAAEKDGDVKSRKPWQVRSSEVTRYLREQLKDQGVVFGRGGAVVGPVGGEADAAVAAGVGLVHGPEAQAAFEAAQRRRQLLEQVADTLSSDPAVAEAFEELDEEAAIEREARRLAERVRRADRIRERAREILDEDGPAAV